MPRIITQLGPIGPVVFAIKINKQKNDHSLDEEIRPPERGDLLPMAKRKHASSGHFSSGEIESSWSRRSSAKQIHGSGRIMFSDTIYVEDRIGPERPIAVMCFLRRPPRAVNVQCAVAQSSMGSLLLQRLFNKTATTCGKAHSVSGHDPRSTLCLAQ